MRENEMSDAPDPLEVTLRERFGLQAFRPWQREAIEALLDGGKVLAVAPTGGGKSLTYQLTAEVLGGTSIVVSPLIALMEDQVRSLHERGISATYVASSLDPDEQKRRLNAIAQGEYRLVYVAPERFKSDRTVRMLADLRPALVAIDEAHCISQWGHDFRPDYLRIGRMLERLAPERVLACTATATPTVRDEILEKLSLQDAKVILRGFARPNLHLEAVMVDSTRDRKRRLAAALEAALGEAKSPEGAAIVYAATRKQTEKVAGELRGAGWDCAAYHAGLGPETRHDVNARFAGGELDIVVATNAFGMGIDRADIRLVAHVQAPGSIEAYYQEVGRAGRDGEPAHGLLLSGSADLGLWKRMIEQPYAAAPPPERMVARRWQLFLDLMRYIEAGSCRHDFILRYFGDEDEVLGGCGHCDVCELVEKEGERVISDDDRQTVRKALAGVARARGRVGMRAVAAMLAGKKGNATAKRNGLQNLSTFGLLSSQGEEWVVALLRRLLSAGLVWLTPGEYPCLRITPRGVAVMKEEEQVDVVLPRIRPAKKFARKAKGSGSAVRPSGADGELFEHLRDVRLQLARERSIPAYMICSDRTLAEIATTKPKSRIDLLRIHGMGDAKVRDYGEALLEAIAAA